MPNKDLSTKALATTGTNSLREKGLKIAKIASNGGSLEDATVCSKSSLHHVEDSNDTSSFPVESHHEGSPALPTYEAPILEASTPLCTNSPLPIGRTLFGMSRLTLFDVDPPLEASHRGTLEALDYRKLLSRFDSLVHDEAPLGSSQALNRVPLDIASIISICTLNALLYNSLSLRVASHVSRLLTPIFVGSDYDLTAQVHLLHYFALRMALAFVSGDSLHHARSHVFGKLSLEHTLLSPSCVSWFSHSLACGEIWASLRGALFALPDSSSGSECSYPPSWGCPVPLSSSTECALHPFHVCPSPSVWWEEDIIKERCKIRVAHQHVGHMLRLTTREWMSALLPIPSLVKVKDVWHHPILDEWCSNPLILEDPSCALSSCRCHRGRSKFCSWRCSKTIGHKGCVKINHPRFHDHYKYYLVNNPKELVPKYCTGMPVMSSPKFKGVPP